MNNINPFEKVQEATEHDEQADKLRDEATQEVKSIVADHYDLDDVSVEVEYDKHLDVFNVYVHPDTLVNSLKQEFGDVDAVENSPAVLQIGNGTRQLRAKEIVNQIERHHDDGAPITAVIEKLEGAGLSQGTAEDAIEKLRRKGEVYEPKTDHLRTT